MDYLLLKFLHILGAVTIGGTGAGIAFFMFMANRSNNIQAIAVTAKNVVLADWIFTTPAVIIQLITGVLLMLRLGYSFTATWFLVVIALFIFIGVCWLPVVVIQYRLKALAEQSLNTHVISPQFKQLMRWWTALGIPAFLALLVIFYLMIFKPLPLA